MPLSVECFVQVYNDDAKGWYLLTKGSLPKKREYIKTFDLKEGGGQFENLIFK